MANDLFAVQDSDPMREWIALAKQIESFQPSLLKRWKDEYDCWKHHYQHFRDSEQKTFFTQEEDGSLPRTSDQVMRLHRRSLLALWQGGEKCADQLLALPLEGEEAQERLDWQRRLHTLLEALQETLELWHPVNAERIEERKALFAH